MERLEPYMTPEERLEVRQSLEADKVHAMVTLIEAGTKRAVQKSLAHYRKQAVLGFVALFIGLLGALAIQRYDVTQTNNAIVRSGSVVAVDGCNRDFARDMRWRRTFVRLRQSSRASYKAGRTTQASYVAAQAFYDKELADLDGALPDCRKAANVITDSTADTPRVPKPLYPGSPEAKKLARPVP